MECLGINKLSQSYLDYADIISDKYLNVFFQEKPGSIQLENFVKFTKILKIGHRKVLSKSHHHLQESKMQEIVTVYHYLK